MEIESSAEPADFTDFERRGWEANSPGYEAHWLRLVEQTVPATLDAAGVGRRSHLLDVCCGPGTLAQSALARGARVVGIDFSSEALALARRNVPDAEFRQSDAERLPFDDDSFDAVVSGYGVMHVARPDVVLAEMHRVLRPKGRLAVSVWEAPNASNGFGVFFGALKTHGDLDVQLPHGPDFFQFGDEARMSQALTSIGLRDVTALRVDQTWDWDDPLGIVRAVLEGAVRARALLLAQSDDARAAIDAAVREGMAQYRTPSGGYEIPMPAIVGAGRK